jgi:hypothetical protein
MGKRNQPTAKQFDSQEIDNFEHDHSLRVKKVMPYGWNGQSAVADPPKAMATKVTTSGSATYVAKAAPGSAESASVWQAKKVDTSSGVVITFADGNANFDNVATDLTALTYS